jgi:hypothetical protein
MKAIDCVGCVSRSLLCTAEIPARLAFLLEDPYRQAILERLVLLVSVRRPVQLQLLRLQPPRDWMNTDKGLAESNERRDMLTYGYQ